MPPSTSITRLAIEVKDAIDSDPLLGPSSDRKKHFIGIEYEVALEHMLKERGTLIKQQQKYQCIRFSSFTETHRNVVTGIPFESELQLRDKGSSKTPDVVL